MQTKKKKINTYKRKLFYTQYLLHQYNTLNKDKVGDSPSTLLKTDIAMNSIIIRHCWITLPTLPHLINHTIKLTFKTSSPFPKLKPVLCVPIYRDFSFMVSYLEGTQTQRGGVNHVLMPFSFTLLYLFSHCTFCEIT